MKPITATAIGIVLAAGLAWASPTDGAADLVNRYYASTTTEGLAASWRDWHPEATHTIETLTGVSGGDWEFTYKMADWETLPDWSEDPELKEAMKGYNATSRSAPKLSVTTKDATTIVTSEIKVGYEWDGYKGTMMQSDQFRIETVAGKPVIRTLITTHDYR